MQQLQTVGSTDAALTGTAARAATGSTVANPGGCIQQQPSQSQNLLRRRHAATAVSFATFTPTKMEREDRIVRVQLLIRFEHRNIASSLGLHIDIGKDSALRLSDAEELVSIRDLQYSSLTDLDLASEVSHRSHDTALRLQKAT